jgi:hypothetical protein
MKQFCTFILLTLAFYVSSCKESNTEKSVPTELVADNGTLTVKFDLTRGGAISWISLSGSKRSLVNIADEGRYIQQSYYAGKSLDRKADGQSPSLNMHDPRF